MIREPQKIPPEKWLSRENAGFTLVEMAIVLLIIGLLLGGLMMPLSVQMDQRRISETQKALDEFNQALIGFAIVNGRLPCPASAASAGIESPAGGGICASPDGFLPAATLGLPQTDGLGYAVDAWGLTQNRIRYAVTTANGNAVTTTGGMRTTTMAVLAPDLHVCASATGITGTTCGAVSLTTNAVAVIYSLGGNAPTGGAGIDEAANLNGDPVFVSHTATSSGAPNGEFDDLVVWISPNILFNRMVAAGQLP